MSLKQQNATASWVQSKEPLNIIRLVCLSVRLSAVIAYKRQQVVKYEFSTFVLVNSLHAAPAESVVHPDLIVSCAL